MRGFVRLHKTAPFQTFPFCPSLASNGSKRRPPFLKPAHSFHGGKHGEVGPVHSDLNLHDGRQFQTPLDCWRIRNICPSCGDVSAQRMSKERGRRQYGALSLLCLLQRGIPSLARLLAPKNRGCRTRQLYVLLAIPNHVIPERRKSPHEHRHSFSRPNAEPMLNRPRCRCPRA